MWEAITGWNGWSSVGATGGWLITIGLIIIGLLGCIIPVIPGHLMILIAAISHRLVFGPESGVEWWTFVVLGVLLAASQIFEWVSGAVGAKWFGGTKWGAVGAIIGGIVGMFFMPLGLILGPLIGAYVCEALFTDKNMRESVKSGVGSAVGTIVSLVVKVVVGVLMASWLIIDILWVG